VFLEDVVESLADGVDIDWNALENRLGTDGDRRVLEQLKVLARIAEVHRSHASEPDDPPMARTRFPAKVIPMPALQPAPQFSPQGGFADAGRMPGAAAAGDPQIDAAANAGANAAANVAGTSTVAIDRTPSFAWGHLEVHEVIGEGTFGEVYRARDTQLDREVAVKLLRVGGLSTDRQARRVLREGRSLARVDHANVVTVYGAETHDGRVGLWMQLIRGATLEQLLKHQGAFSAREATLIGQDLCSAVSAVHNAGLVHRDIKAQNVMREEGGRLVLMDFGAGQLVGTDTAQLDRLTGTPLYLAPEVLAGGESTPRSDIYSLGVLLYHLVTNDYPTRASSLQELREAHAQGRRVHLRDVRPQLRDGLVAVIERAIDPDASRRYGTAGEMRAALDHALNGPELRAKRAVWAPLVRPVAPLLAPRLRNRALPMLLAVAILGLAIGGVFVWQAYRSSPVMTVAPHQPRVIAVMQLASGNGVAEQEALGVTESLQDLLSSINTIRVVSRRSVRAVSSGNLDATALSQKLGADTLIEGRLEQADDEYRMSLRLVRAGVETPLGTFVEPLATRQKLLKKAATAVAGALDVKLPEAIDRRMKSAEQLGNAAHDRYFRARYFLNTVAYGNHPDVAVQYFQEAIDAAPAYGEAWAGLARARYYLALSPKENLWARLSQAREAANEALELDGTLAEAHAVIGVVNFYEWKWAEAEAAFKQAVALNPSHDFAAERYGAFLAARGRVAEGLAYLVQARRIDPLSPLVACATASMLQYDGRFEEALQEVQRARSLDPSDPASLVVQGRILAAMGRHDEAIASFRKTFDSSGGTRMPLAEIAASEAASGRRDEALKLLAQLETPEPQPAGERFQPELLAFVYGQLGEYDEAFDRLTKAMDEHPPRLLWLKVDPRARPLRNDRRFAELLKSMGLNP
jgi:tetratricopeptide (TPR) repeat protein/tRNA A-37 threonylcarbamoyl transferase component Bud32